MSAPVATPSPSLLGDNAEHLMSLPLWPEILESLPREIASSKEHQCALWRFSSAVERIETMPPPFEWFAGVPSVHDICELSLEEQHAIRRKIRRGVLLFERMCELKACVVENGLVAFYSVIADGTTRGYDPLLVIEEFRKSKWPYADYLCTADLVARNYDRPILDLARDCKLVVSRDSRADVLHAVIDQCVAFAKLNMQTNASRVLSLIQICGYNAPHCLLDFIAENNSAPTMAAMVGSVKGRRLDFVSLSAQPVEYFTSICRAGGRQYPDLTAMYNAPDYSADDDDGENDQVHGEHLPYEVMSSEHLRDSLKAWHKSISRLDRICPPDQWFESIPADADPDSVCYEDRVALRKALALGVDRFSEYCLAVVTVAGNGNWFVQELFTNSFDLGYDARSVLTDIAESDLKNHSRLTLDSLSDLILGFDVEALAGICKQALKCDKESGAPYRLVVDCEAQCASLRIAKAGQFVRMYTMCSLQPPESLVRLSTAPMPVDDRPAIARAFESKRFNEWSDLDRPDEYNFKYSRRSFKTFASKRPNPDPTSD